MQVWGDGSPVTFTHFTNSRFGSNHITSISWCKVETNFQSVLPKCVSTESSKQSSTQCLSLASQPVLQPSTNHRCSVVLLENLAYPEWVKVNCSKNILQIISCTTKDDNHTGMSVQGNTDNIKHFCPTSRLLHNNTCVFINRTRQSEVSKESLMKNCRQLKMSVLSFESISGTDFVTDVYPISPILLMTGEGDVVLYSYFQHASVYHPEPHQNVTNATGLTGFNICGAKPRKFVQGEHLHHCVTSKEYISARYVCDNGKHCGDDSDEKFCSCGAFKSQKYETTCQHRELNNRTCIPILKLTERGVCAKFAPHTFTNKSMKEAKVSKTQLDNCEISTELIDDLFPDCTTGHDEGALMQVLTHQNSFLCPPHQIACLPGHFKCFNISLLCSFELNMFNTLIPCRNGAHLSDCKQFECNSFFKCTESYCIPWTNVCDNKWDCQNGEEELAQHCEKTRTCSGMFKCSSPPQFCIHVGSVCNGLDDCSDAEEELFCSLKAFVCPTQCRCLLFAIICERMNNLPSVELRSHIKVTITHIPLSMDHLSHFENVEILEITSGNLSSVCKVLTSKRLSNLNGSSNLIQELQENCFETPVDLQQVDLSKNKMLDLERKAFGNLLFLSELNLANNRLNTFPSQLFHPSSCLHLLTLFGNPFKAVSVESFQYIPAKFVKTDNFSICCIVSSETSCNTGPPWHLSCSNLLFNISLRTTLIVMASTILLLNIASLFIQYKQRKGSEQYALTVGTINMTEKFHSYSLATIYISDLILGQNFLFEGAVWRQSSICYASFAFFLNCNFLFSALHVLLATSRLMVVLHPFKSKFKETKFVGQCLLVLVLASCTITLLVSVTFKLIISSVPNLMCHPFVDTHERIVFVKVLICTMTLLHLSASSSIVCFSVLLFQSFKKSQKNVSRSHSGKDSNRALVIQLVTLSSSCILYWLPADIIYSTSNFLSQYPVEMVLWTFALVVPLNSICGVCIFLAASVKALIKAGAKKTI